MATYAVPAPAALADPRQLGRLHAALAAKGYQLAGGLSLVRDQASGALTVVLDCDRDPSADVAAFAPPPAPPAAPLDDLLDALLAVPAVAAQLGALAARRQARRDWERAGLPPGLIADGTSS